MVVVVVVVVSNSNNVTNRMQFYCGSKEKKMSAIKYLIQEWTIMFTRVVIMLRRMYVVDAIFIVVHVT